jgi:hypothetical protein
MKNRLVGVLLVLIIQHSLFAQQYDSLSSLVIDKYLSESGGRENWMLIKSRWDSIHCFQYGKKSNMNTFKKEKLNHKAQILNMSQSPYRVTFNIFKSPNMFKYIHINSLHKEEIMCVNQQHFWTKFGDKKAEIMPDDHRKYAESTMAHCGLAYFFLQKDASSSYVAQILYKGNEYHVIKFIRKEWLAHSVYLFNTKTNLIDYLTTERFLDRLGGKEIDFVRMEHFKEYKNIDGFLVHTIVEGYKDNFLESKYVTISTKFNIDIPNEEFDVPKN